MTDEHPQKPTLKDMLYQWWLVLIKIFSFVGFVVGFVAAVLGIIAFFAPGTVYNKLDTVIEVLEELQEASSNTTIIYEQKLGESVYGEISGVGICGQSGVEYTGYVASRGLPVIYDVKLYDKNETVAFELGPLSLKTPQQVGFFSDKPIEFSCFSVSHEDKTVNYRGSVLWETVPSVDRCSTGDVVQYFMGPSSVTSLEPGEKCP